MPAHGLACSSPYFIRHSAGPRYHAAQLGRVPPAQHPPCKSLQEAWPTPFSAGTEVVVVETRVIRRDTHSAIITQPTWWHTKERERAIVSFRLYNRDETSIIHSRFERQQRVSPFSPAEYAGTADRRARRSVNTKLAQIESLRAHCLEQRIIGSMQHKDQTHAIFALRFPGTVDGARCRTLVQQCGVSLIHAMLSGINSRDLTDRLNGAMHNRRSH